MSKMNPKIKAQWVAALRSGEYKKGMGQLRDERGSKTAFCCLGVLCNLHAQAHPEIAAQQQDASYYMGEMALAPDEVYAWAGLEKDATVRIDHSVSELAVHNDNGKTFKQIANAIQKQL